jgi:hypothetical protein
MSRHRNIRNAHYDDYYDDGEDDDYYYDDCKNVSFRFDDNCLLIVVFIFLLFSLKI